MFAQRLFSFLLLWSIILALVWSQSDFFAVGLLLLIGVVGQWEFYKLMKKAGFSVFKKTGLLFGVLSLAVCGPAWVLLWSMSPEMGDLQYAFDATSIDFAFDLMILFMIALCFYKKEPRQAFLGVMLTWFGVLYVPCLLNAFLLLLSNPHFSWSAILYCIAVTKMADAGAYIAGSLFGRHPIAPAISPRKTWEGFIGSILFAYLTSWGLAWLSVISIFEKHFTPYLGLNGIVTTPIALHHSVYVWILPPLLAATGALGDLVESMIKRTAEVKDSGRFIPGMGGALDLVDSLLFTAPMCYFVLSFLESFQRNGMMTELMQVFSSYI